DIDLQGQLDSFRRVSVDYAMNSNHADRYGGQVTGWQPQGVYTNSADVEPGTKVNTISYKYEYAGGGYYNVLMTWVIELLDNNSVQVSFNAVMNSDNTGSDRVVSTPWSAIIEPGKSVSADFNGLN